MCPFPVLIGSPKLKRITQYVGVDACTRLQRRSENALRATGDKLMFSPTGRATRANYDELLFPLCSNNVDACLQAALLMPDLTPTLSDEVVPLVPGEGASTTKTRLICSRFRRLHAAQLLKWHMRQWNTTEIEQQRDEVLQAVDLIVTEYCRAEGIHNAPCEAFKRKLREVATPRKRKRGQQEEMRVEEMATLLWTTADPVVLWHPRKGNIELCHIINAALRTDGASAASAASSSNSSTDVQPASPQLAPAVLLTCMLQLHTNATRRAGYHEHVRWPCGPRVGEEWQEHRKGQSLPWFYAPGRAQGLF